jgi:hypothetical protein
VLPELHHPVGREASAVGVGALEIDELELASLQALLRLRVVELGEQRLWPCGVEDADAFVTGAQPRPEERGEHVVTFRAVRDGADMVSCLDLETR